MHGLVSANSSCSIIISFSSMSKSFFMKLYEQIPATFFLSPSYEFLCTTLCMFPNGKNHTLTTEYKEARCSKICRQISVQTCQLLGLILSIPEVTNYKLSTT
jgi:hypothetical protein